MNDKKNKVNELAESLMALDRGVCVGLRLFTSPTKVVQNFFTKTGDQW